MRCGFCHPQELSERDEDERERFIRYLRDEMDPHERLAYMRGEPMSSANDPLSAGMGC